MEQQAIRVKGPSGDLPAYLRCAVDYILANLAEPFLLDDIAAAAGASKRTLHLGFQMHFGLSVMAFVRQHRLEQANQRLLAGDVESTTVTTIAMNCGFQHLSRFSSIYRQCFGEYPSETLRRRSCRALAAVAHSPSSARRPRVPIGGEPSVLVRLGSSRAGYGSRGIHTKKDDREPSAPHP